MFEWKRFVLILTLFAVAAENTSAFVFPVKVRSDVSKGYSLGRRSLAPTKWDDLTEKLFTNGASQSSPGLDFSTPMRSLWSLLEDISTDASLPTLPDQLATPASLETLYTAAITSMATPWHAAAIAVFTTGSAFLSFVNSPLNFTSTPFESGNDTYSPSLSDTFYSKKWPMVIKRLIQLSFISGSFTSGLLFDWLILGKLLKDENYEALKRNEPRRAKQAVKLCEQLGPTFIKLGQALSIRTDLVPEAYALELRALQDAVAPFPNEQAMDILKRELGVEDLSLLFSSLTKDPIAAASVGQVYKGALAENGKEVAVKVQRPGILAEIALDLYILRLLTPLQTRLQNMANGVSTEQDDIDLAIALVDEWGRGFVAETDYRLEAQNTIQFESAMRERNLDAVCAPTVVEEFVRDKVLVTQWVEGTRLDLDASPDVPRLCGVAINAYLTMLLDTGVLHCDPHKGNLLRTSDGKLCILDWGMTLTVPKDLQYSLLEFIAHINVEDYDAIPQDFINLGFSPPDVTPERLQSSGITEGLSFAFRQLAAGGGPKKIQERVKEEFKDLYGSQLSDEELRLAARADMMQRMEAQLASEGIDVKGVTNVMEEVSRRNRELFSLPPYVLYLARAFSTLEGIGLGIDENYAIIQECYPYLASRLFTDRNPRAKKALKAMLGIASEEESLGVRAIEIDEDSSVEHIDTNAVKSPAKSFSPDKLLEMSEGFASYTAATGSVDRDGEGQARAATEFTRLFLDPKGSTLQDIFVDEAVKLTDALTRATLRAALVENPAAKSASRVLKAPKSLIEQNQQLDQFLPGPLREALVDRPAELPALVESWVASTEEDERLISAVDELSNVLGPRISQSLNGPEENAAAVVTNLISDNEARNAVIEQVPGAIALTRRVGAGLLRRAAYRTRSTPGIPEGTKRGVIEVNEALADVLEPESGDKL